MTPYWMTFSGGRGACIEADNEEKAREVAASRGLEPLTVGATVRRFVGIRSNALGTRRVQIIDEPAQNKETEQCLQTSKHL